MLTDRTHVAVIPLQLATSYVCSCRCLSVPSQHAWMDEVQTWTCLYCVYTAVQAIFGGLLPGSIWTGFRIGSWFRILRSHSSWRWFKWSTRGAWVSAVAARGEQTVEACQPSDVQAIVPCYPVIGVLVWIYLDTFWNYPKSFLTISEKGVSAEEEKPQRGHGCRNGCRNGCRAVEKSAEMKEVKSFWIIWLS